MCQEMGDIKIGVCTVHTSQLSLLQNDKQCFVFWSIEHENDDTVSQIGLIEIGVGLDCVLLLSKFLLKLALLRPVCLSWSTLIIIFTHDFIKKVTFFLYKLFPKISFFALNFCAE